MGRCIPRRGESALYCPIRVSGELTTGEADHVPMVGLYGAVATRGGWEGLYANGC